MTKEFPARLNPEVELLLWCARAPIKNDRSKTVRTLLQSPIEWRHLSIMAKRNGLAPLLYRHLQSIATETIPHVYMRELEGFFRENAARNLLLDAELRRVLQLFEAHHIEALSYKGPTLARMAYGDTAWRCFSDLDILIGEADLKQVTELLLAHGYSSPYRMSDARHAAYLRSRGEQLFTRLDKLVHLDIHWALTPRSVSNAFRAEPFLLRAKKNKTDAEAVKTLSIEDLLLVLCVHNGRELWKRLVWVADIAALVSAHPDLDWEQLIDEARHARVLRLLLLGLHLAHELLKVELPESILRLAEKDRQVKSLSRQVQQNYFHDRRHQIRLAEACLFHLRARESLRDGLRYGMHLIAEPTPKEWAALPLPESLRAFYYVIRPMRILKQRLLSGRSPEKTGAAGF